ncbi:MAG: FAD-linked oxidase C-terminal domain-containing protein [Chloroflexota bacterium]
MSLPHEFLYELHKHFTGDIRTDLASRILYSTDASIYQIEPTGVVLPRTQEDLIAAVELAAKYKIPILPRGAGTSLAGQAVGHALILDCSRYLNQIVDIDPEAHTAIVEPGVVLATLNQAAAKHGLMFGPDPASAERATMGGVIGNNATGAHSILYGMSADHLISSDVILAGGSLEIWGEVNDQLSVSSHQSKIISTAMLIREKYAEAIRQNYPRSWRNSAGYRINYLLPWSPSAPPRWIGDAYPANLKPDTWNLAHLLAGSEGTLAVIRKLKVNLVPKPKHTVLGILAYDSIAEACDDVPRLLSHRPSAVELIPQMILHLARSVPAYARQMDWMSGDPAAILVVEFSGDVPSELLKKIQTVRDDVFIAQTKEQQTQVWNIRKVGLGILDSRPQSARPIAFIEDCAIPVEQLGDFVREIEKILFAHGTYGGIYAHASGGCLHIRPVLDLKTGEGLHSMRSIAEAALQLTLSLGGSMSSEHGDGIARGEWLKSTYGAEVVQAMNMLKQAADPDHILNPNKMFDAPKMDSNLRYKENSSAQTWVPVLDFSRNGSLMTAIEQCNGQGVCKKDTGVMCPSFQATREEQNSTRGRANLLRVLIAFGNQQLAVGKQRSELVEATYHALDLCLACKGCKAECPSGVDMAKLKYEFENQYYKTHRRPLRDYVFGYFDVAAKLASMIAPLSNMLMQNRLVKNSTAKVLGITSQRPFPKFAGRRANFLTTESRRHGEKIIFLSDPFSRYIEPQVEQAAFDVLSACGYDVQVAPVIGAGASLLSKGFLAAAKRHAGKMLDALNQLDPRHEAAIVGIEPPEIYTLKHDYLDLLPERKDEIASRAARTWLLDEYLLRSEKFSTLQLRSAPLGAINVKFQPHCHQRAEGLAPDGLPSGTSATLELLRVCGYEVELIEAGCCGMAGTFGYEAEHFELSMKVGELKLFPKIREWKMEKREFGIVSTGAACRMQIQQGADADAVHPILLVRAVLLD